MIFVLALLGFAGLLIALTLLLRDFFRFIWKKTKMITIPCKFVDFGPYLVTVFFAAAFAALGDLFFKVGMAIFAYFLSNDLISFFVLLRGVFSLSNELQHPLETEHVLAGLLLTQLLQFLAIYLMYWGLRKFMHLINRAYNSTSYTESDILYFGFLSSIFFVLIELILYSQNIPTVSAVAHLTFLGFSKLSIVAFFLSISHIHLLRNPQYRNSISTYVEMNAVTKIVINSPILVLFITYCISLLLHLPFYTGSQFLNNNWAIVGVYVLSCVTSFYALRLLLSSSYNYLGVVMLAENSQHLDVRNKLLEPYTAKRYFLLLGGVALFFGLFKLKLFFFFTVITTLAIMVFLSVLVLFYVIGFAGSLFRALWFDYSTPRIDPKYISNYLLVTSRSFISSCGFMLGIVFLSFVFISFYPKSFEHKSDNQVHAVVDEDGKFLYVDRSPKNPSVPIEYEQLPPFLVKCLVLQEDRQFFGQESWWPNRSNWHGLSMSMFYRYFSGGGGSNLTQQLIKNLAFSNVFPQDIQRKFAETITAYQLSIQCDPKDILTSYFNEVGFNGGFGHSGIMTSSLFTFGRTPTKLNYMEMLYLVETLKRGTDIRTLNGYVKYKNAPANSTTIKTALIRKAQLWYKRDLLTKNEFNILRNNQLRFPKRPFEISCAPATNIFIKKQLAKESKKPGIHRSSLSILNQRKVSKAINRFQRSFRAQLKKRDFKLCAAAIAVDVTSGRIEGHYGGEGVANLASFGNGYPVGSVIKPFIIIELLENGWGFDEVQLYDGKMKGRFTPKNFSGTYSNQYVGIRKILGSSLNAPVVNVREYMTPMQLIENVEHRFAVMDFPPDRYLDLSNPDKSGEYEVNYPLGSRNMTVQNIAQMFQVLLNNGVYRKLSVLTPAESIAAETADLHSNPEIQIYQPANANAISSALSYAMKPGGTGTHFRRFLPKGRTYFAKTGTSDGSRHGYTVLSDGKLLIVSWVSYCKEENGRLECNKTPPIPNGSGAQSAGALAAMIYSSLGSNK